MRVGKRRAGNPCVVDSSLRRVTVYPITELWDESGPVAGHPVRGELTEAEVKEMLRRGPVQFVSMVFGQRPEWVSLTESYVFWKKRLKPLLTQWGDEGRIYTDEMPVYLASEWACDGFECPIVVATMHD